MTTGSLGLRSSGSYGSLQQVQNSSLSFSIQTSPPLSRKPSKMLKEKDRLFFWIFRFAPRKKVGMLLLCLVSLAVFMWVLIVGKGEDARESITRNVNIAPGPISEEKVSIVGAPPSQIIEMEGSANATPLSPPTVFFTGYKLPPGNPCEHFTLPPPPADKKRTGPRPCPVCYLPLEDAIALMPNAPSFSPVLKDLTYVHEENLSKSEFGGSDFGGYPSLKQRSDSYDIRESMSVHCGFVGGVKPGHQTGFDIDDSDLLEMEKCRGVVVASAIFGAFDLIRQPKNVSEYSQKTVCFHMFVDEETKAFLRNSSELGSDKKVGLWRVTVVRNLPYSDPRRNGKVPKLLLHRLFPNARYSLWIDAKLELVVDPIQILERFLWRKNASFAISRHYRRFDVFVEAEANKAAGKYDNASIDFQIDFYKKEGLTPYSAAKLPITSDVPEGCVIVREHIPITNLFTCLWFNEVDRFTSRDQISFSTVRDKIRSKTNYTINMFLDCERRNFVIQGYHRDLLEHWSPPPPASVISNVHPPPPIVMVDGTKIPTNISTSSPIKKVPTKRGKDRRWRRHRKIVIGSKDASTSNNFV
ncbi:uncharacterized protein LOC105167904 isoform X2 [Sesamum indicum]|uniref:Uncharacterized protein LOC105167904 isoform X2 n=1 Tax=Sesamum indicum TaxID=4182 RepID=A0A6I9TJR6_SESIN|nr:uncharacterized protein LOC105167904 isoform X2 [Sesamum indicum]